MRERENMEQNEKQKSNIIASSNTRSWQKPRGKGRKRNRMEKYVRRRRKKSLRKLDRRIVNKSMWKKAVCQVVSQVRYDPISILCQWHILKTDAETCVSVPNHFVKITTVPFMQTLVIGCKTNVRLPPFPKWLEARRVTQRAILAPEASPPLKLPS